MDNNAIDNIKSAANEEVVRRMLIKYFIDKGFTQTFGRHICPTLLQDLPYIIPVLASKVEVLPTAEEVDLMGGRAKLNWNLFVLGNKRMFLGETHHSDLSELAKQINSGMILPTGIASRRQTTPEKIISFITRVLAGQTGGYVHLVPSASSANRRLGDSFSGNIAAMGVSNRYGFH
jgi:hypothetical protein